MIQLFHVKHNAFMESALQLLIAALSAMGHNTGLTAWADGSICIHRPDKALGEWVSLQSVARELDAASYKAGG